MGFVFEAFPKLSSMQPHLDAGRDPQFPFQLGQASEDCLETLYQDGMSTRECETNLGRINYGNSSLFLQLEWDPAYNFFNCHFRLF